MKHRIPLVEREINFKPSYPMSVYHKAAQMNQQIADDLEKLAVAKLSLATKL